MNRFAIPKSIGTVPEIKREAPAKSVAEKDLTVFRMGQKVMHKKFGEGTIINLKGEGRDRTADIAFRGLGIKSFALLVAPIEPVED